MQSVFQKSFALGEWSPTLWKRSDMKGYGQAVKEMVNFFPTYWGAALNRSGWKYFCACKIGSDRIRLIPFNSGDETYQNYVLEVGDLYIRIHGPDGTVEDPLNPGNPLELITPYTDDEIPRLKYSQVNDIIVLTHRNHPPMELRRYGHQDWRLVRIDERRRPRAWVPIASLGAIPEGTIFWGANIFAPYNPNLLFTVETTADIADLSACGGNISIRKDLCSPTMSFNTAPVIDPADSARRWEWVIQAVYADGTKSLPSVPYKCAWRNDANSFKCSLSTTNSVSLHIVKAGGASYFEIYRGRDGVYGLIGTTKPNFVDATGCAADFVDEGGDPDMGTNPRSLTVPFGTRTWTPYTYFASGDYIESDGNIYRARQNGFSAATAPNGDADFIDGVIPNWEANHVYAAHSIVRNHGCVFFTDLGGTSAVAPTSGPYVGQGGGAADGTVTWYAIQDGGSFEWEYIGPSADYPLRWPAASSHFELRRVFGGTEEEPGRLFFSKTNQFYDLERTLLPKSDDPLSFELASMRRQEIRSLAGLRYLLTMSNSSEWVVTGAQRGDPIGPDSINAKVHSERGSSWLSPIVVGEGLIYVQPKGKFVRELIYNAQQEMLVSNDISLMSRHLFDSSTIVDWCYAEDPYGIIWAARSDGVLLSMTYQKELGIFGWARHTRDALVESVCSIPSEGYDEVWAVFLRNGIRQIERMSSRASNPKFLDSYVEYSNVNLLVFTGLDHLEGEEVSIVVDGHVYTATVDTGQVDMTEVLETPHGSVYIGIPYSGYLHMLDVPEAEARKKIVKEAIVEVEASRGLWITNDPTKDGVEWRQRVVGEEVPPLYTGPVKMSVPGGWGYSGRILVRFTDPFPVSILSVDREVESEGDLGRRQLATS